MTKNEPDGSAGGSASDRPESDAPAPNSSKSVSATQVVDAPAAAIFAVLADASQHASFDGSGTVQATRGDTEPLTLGARFGMKMRLGPLPYAMSNTVVEFEPDRLIAWRHYGGHRWRYQLEPIDDATTQVTETFDWSTAPLPTQILVQAVGYPERNRRSIEATLERLAERFTAD